MASPEFSTVQVAALTGLSVRQLDYWAHQGIYTPELQQASGPGTRKRYSVADVVHLRSLRRLKGFRWPTQKLRRTIEMLRDATNDPNPLRHSTFIADRNTLLAAYRSDSGEERLLDGMKAGGQQVLSLVLERDDAAARQLVLQYAIEGGGNE